MTEASMTIPSDLKHLLKPCVHSSTPEDLHKGMEPKDAQHEYGNFAKFGVRIVYVVLDLGPL